MTADEEKPAATAPSRMQFSLGTLLLLPVAIGCALAVLFTKPPNVAATELLAIGILLPAAFTGGIVYSKGYKRAFCIGAIFPAGALSLLFIYLLANMGFSNSWDLSLFLFMFECLFGGGLLLAIVSGGLCVGIRSLSLRAIVADGSTRRHGWGRAIFCLAIALLVLSGPIVGRIGISLGWWGADAAPPGPYLAPPVTYQAPTTGTYSPTGYGAPLPGYPNSSTPSLAPESPSAEPPVPTNAAPPPAAPTGTNKR
jgi:hypothetical protein